MFKERLRQITTYEAGKPIELVMREYGIKKEDIIKLGSNENPYGTSPKVIESLQHNAYKAYLYPDDSMFELKNALASHFHVKERQIIIGAGSDQILEFCMQALQKAQVIMAKTTFAMYEVYAKLYGAKICKTQTEQHNIAAFKQLYTDIYAHSARCSDIESTRVSAIFLCVPNNPLGECLGSQEIVDFIHFVRSIDKETLIILDGAYQEFAACKDKTKALCPASLIKDFDNVIYLGTFSKVYGLGGMRVGYGIACENIIDMLYKVRPPFNITTLSLQAAQTALNDQDFVQKCIESNAKEMLRYEAYAKDNGFSYTQSFCNFITLSRKDIESSHLCQWLLQKGVIIRNLASYGLNAFRITIGTHTQNTRVFELLETYLRTHN